MHTEGPWENDAMACYVMAGNMTVCQIRGWGYLTGVGGLQLSDAEAERIQQANARLIAAAPDLLKALKYARKGLKECVDDTEGSSVGDWFADLVTRADAAIAKAESSRLDGATVTLKLGEK